MNTKTKIKEVYFGLAGLIGLILIIILATTLTPGSVYESSLSLNPAAPQCSALNVTSVPTPLRSGKSALILVKPVPESWHGKIRISATDGILNDGYGNEGSIIETNEQVVSYGGGGENERITVQASEDLSGQCLGTLEIKGDTAKSCQSLKIVTDPPVLTENQSAIITVVTGPDDFDGTFLLQSDSGKFRLTSADMSAQGENTGTMVTSNKSAIYNGGKSGEKLTVTALGEKNAACKDQLEIAAGK